MYCVVTIDVIVQALDKTPSIQTFDPNTDEPKKPSPPP